MQKHQIGLRSLDISLFMCEIILNEIAEKAKTFFAGGQQFFSAVAILGKYLNMNGKYFNFNMIWKILTRIALTRIKNSSNFISPNVGEPNVCATCRCITKLGIYEGKSTANRVASIWLLIQILIHKASIENYAIKAQRYEQKIRKYSASGARFSVKFSRIPVRLVTRKFYLTSHSRDQ